jgi:O-antigen ligase
MNYNQIKALVIFAVAIVFAVWMGYAIADENYGLLIMGACASIATILLLMPGYAPLLAFGLLDPFNVPLPMIWGFPPLALVLGFCLLKYALQRGLAKNAKDRPINATFLLFWVFFGWIVFRFCLNPIFPNLAGFGENTTGFRSYMSYALCFGLMITLGRFIQSRSDLLRLARWLAWISVFFIFLFVPLMFTQNFTVGSVLTYLGIFVSAYDNGVFRFVVLPGFGITLISLVLLPQLLPIKRSARIFLLLLGIAAVVLGGSRNGLGMATAIIIVIPLLKRNFQRFGTILLTTIFLYVGAYFVGENLGSHDQTGVFRVLALVSPKAADSTQAMGTLEWREIRWRRAWEEIQNRPWVGRGYGGVQNAFVWGDYSGFEEARVEIDLASGGIHNGYIACALAFGIPAALLFIGILARVIWHNGRLAIRLTSKDPFASSIHAFVCASLIAYALTIYIGTDLNNPMLWLFMGLGVLAPRLRPIENKTTEPAALLVPQSVPA